MITRRKKLLRKTPLRRVSRKRARELRTYSGLRRDFLATHPRCEIARKGICTGQAQDVHHVHRRGLHLNDVGTWLAVCRCCHDWTHTHPGQARVLGFLA